MTALREGDRALGRCDFAAAADAYGRWLEGRPGEAHTRARRALCLHEAGRASEAAREGDRAVDELGPGHPATLFYALALADAGRTGRAEALARAVAEAEPANLFAAGLLALTALRDGRAAEALALLDERGVFAFPLFRAHLLAEAEACLSRLESDEAWTEGYLRMVL